MSHKTYIARTDAEARGLHEGAVTEIVVPMPKPPMGCVYLMNGNGDKACCYAKDRDLGNYTGPCWVPPTPESKDHLLTAPYSPGDVIAVKESVATDGPWNIPSECHYWYPADGGEQPKGYQLRSTKKMPLEAIRTRLTCLSVHPEQRDGHWVWCVKVKRLP